MNILPICQLFLVTEESPGNKTYVCFRSFLHNELRYLGLQDSCVNASGCISVGRNVLPRVTFTETNGSSFGERGARGRVSCSGLFFIYLFIF